MSVAAAISFLEARFDGVGLSLNRGKYELIPTAGRDHGVGATLFQGFEIKESGDFKLLGRPSGHRSSARHCRVKYA